MKWIKKTYLQCIPLRFGVCLSFYCFLALLRNHSYSFHRTKWRLVTSICRGPGPVATRMPFFSPRSNPLQTFQLQLKRETSSSPLGDRLEKRSIISPLNRAICAGRRGTSGFRPVPVTTVAFTNKFALLTISTYTTGARTHVLTVQEPSWRVISALLMLSSCKC